MNNYEYLFKLLLDLDEYIDFKKVVLPNLYLLGGTACILGNYLDRATIDFDIIDDSYSPSILKYTKLLGKVDFLDHNLTTIAYGYENRSQKIPGLRALNIYIASCEDIITSKIRRYSNKDIEDIVSLMKTADIKKLNDLIEQVILREDLSSILKKNLIEHVLEFKERFRYV